MLFLNGQKLSQDLALQYFYNRSFKYGDGLFESIRIYRGMPLFWNAHRTRLQRGMDLLHMAYDVDHFFNDLHRDIFRAIDAQDISNGRLRIHVFRSGAGTYRPATNSIEVLIEIAALKTDFFHKPQSVKLTDYRGMSLVKNHLSGLKTANALTYILASQHAQSEGWDDAILFSGDQIAETSAANIFFFSQKKLYTPPLSSGCLAGVMREKILELAQSLKIDVDERPIRWKVLLQADEIFLTNAIKGIMPVTQINAQPFPEPNGSMTAFLGRSLLQYVSIQEGKQST